MKYKILVARTVEELELLVLKNITLGWVPLGGVATTDSPPTFAQAMILEDKGWNLQ